MSKINTADRHLAQLNIARLRYPLDDPRIADFVSNLERVNAVAERTPGFVWRLKGNSGSSATIKAFDDPLLIVNLTVWESVEALERFVWQTVHKRVYGRKEEWFAPMPTPHFVMWWIPAGQIPSLAGAKARLDRLTANGPGDEAFGWESVPAAQHWKMARCGHSTVAA